MLQLSSKQIAELKAYLGPYGLDVRPTPMSRNLKPISPKIKGEGSPGKRPDWWHGNGSGFTRRMVAKHGYFKDARGVYDYQFKGETK